MFYCENYFDSNDILAQSKKIQVTFTRNVNGLGFLDSFGEDPNVIQKGTKLELPLYLVKELYADGVIRITLPAGFNKTWRDILEADANCVNLNKLGPNFYRFGKHLSNMNLPESPDIADSLVDSFSQRFGRLLNYSFVSSGLANIEDASLKELTKCLQSVNRSDTSVNINASSTTETSVLSDITEYTAKLDNLEKEIFLSAQDVTKSVLQWENRESTRLQMNPLIATMQKRKRMQELYGSVELKKT